MKNVSNNIKPCHDNAMCINSIGSYACMCMSGYDGDGYSCKGRSANILSNVEEGDLHFRL